MKNFLALNSKHDLNEHELKALASILIRTGRVGEKLSKAQVNDMLSLGYNLPHWHRSDPAKTIAGVVVSGQMLSTVHRFEIELHLSDPAFRDEIHRAANGVQDELNKVFVSIARGY